MQTLVRSRTLCLLLACALAALASGFLLPAGARAAGDVEYTGKLEPELWAATEDLDQVVFKPLRDPAKIKFATPPEQGARITAGRLYHPPSDKSSILTLLVEPEDELPYLYADLDLNNAMDASERFPLERADEANPYILQAKLKIPMKGGLFQSYPIVVQYFKDVQWDELQEGERLLLQSKAAFARGYVDIQGHKTLVEYGFNPQAKKVAVMSGPLGVDGDGDGEIDMDRFSPEAAEAQEETVIFRVGDHYVSTKRVDLDKNMIVMREHPAADYKRVELSIGGEVPDFNFTDFSGKKHKLSEFRGKYVLLDFWAAWCGPCRRELPYQKAAYSRFQARGFEILGLDNDEDPTLVKTWLARNAITWPQATRDSIKDLEIRYRIHLFPTTLLIDPEGKVVSLNQRKKGQPTLRGADLLKSLDQLLPP
jgi:thiol-disulfide isomerase/thioredoxin